MRYILYFVCMGAGKSRRALPATEEKIGKVLKTAIKRDLAVCGMVVRWGLGLE